MAGERESLDLDATMAAPSLPPSVTGDLDATALVTSTRPSHVAAALLDGPPPRIGRYSILGELGRGGMGIVYSAFDPELDRKIAVKVIRGERSADARARLLREAQAMARLSHPNVVTVHDVGTDGDAVFIAMEFVAGATLGAWIRAGGHGWREALALLRDAGRGLAAAHRVGLVHRDFKPDNVLIADDGAVKITDFGLARTALDADDVRIPIGGPSINLSSALTVDGAIVGTPAYMAPEQHLGAAADARSDQYAFCVSLFEALYGWRPHSGATLAELRASVLGGVVEPPPPTSKVPRWLFPILARGLRTDPDTRWPSLDALLAALDADPARARRRWIAALVGVALVVAAAVGVDRAEAAAAAAREHRCRSAAALAIAPTWSTARRDALQRAILGSGAEGSANAWTTLAAATDALVAEADEAHRSICLEEVSDDPQARRDAPRRRACVTHQLRQLRATLAVLDDADAALVERIDDLIAGFPRIRRCDDPRTLATIAANEEHDGAYENLKLKVEHAKALANAGRYQRAASLLPGVVAASRDTPDVLAEAHIVAGRVHADLGDLPAAEASFLDALRVSLRHGLEIPAADAVIHLVYHFASLSGDFKEAQRWLPLAEALSHRAEDLEIRLGYYNYRGVFELQSGAHAAALATIDEGYRLALALGVRGKNLAALANNRGFALLALGRRAEARAAHEEALSILRASVDDDHPDIPLTLANLGTCALFEGDVDAALAYYRDALKRQEAAFGPSHPQIGIALNNLAGAELDAGDIDAAHAHILRALEILEATLGPDHLYTAYARAGLGDILVRLGRPDPAPLERALAAIEASAGPDHVHAGYPAAILGELAFAAGDLPRARQLLERAHRLRATSEEITRADRARTTFAFAKVLAAQGETAAALARAAEAEDDYAHAGPAHDGKRLAVAAWRLALAP